jgi:hypothetical protein
MKKITLLTLSLLCLSVIHAQNLVEKTKRIDKLLNEKDSCCYLDIYLKTFLNDAEIKNLTEYPLSKDYFKNYTLHCCNVEKEKLIKKLEEEIKTLDDKVKALDDKILKIRITIGNNKIKISEASDFSKWMGVTDFQKYASNVDNLKAINLDNQKYLAEDMVEKAALENTLAEKKIELARVAATTNDAAKTPILSTFAGSILPTPSSIIDGTAQFLVERTKEELNIAFISKFRTLFKDTVQFSNLFPATHNVIMNNDPLNFSTFGKQLQAAAMKDLNEIPYNAIYFLEKENIFKEKKDKELFEAFKIILEAMKIQRNGYHPTNTLVLINQKLGYDKAKKRELDIHKIVSLTNAVAQSFFHTKNNRYESIDDILLLQQKKSQRDIFMSLFAVKNKTLLENISIDKRNIYGEISNNSGIVDNFFNISNEWIVLNTKITAVIDSFKTAKTDDEKLKVYIELNNNIVDCFEFGLKLYNMGEPEDGSLFQDKWFKVYKPIVNNAVDLSNNLMSKNYSSALVSFNGVMGTILDSLLKKNPNDSFDRITHILKITKNLVYWGGFLAEIAESKDHVEVKNLLKKYAEPVGSFSIKRQTNLSLTLNAYPGLYLGGENIINSSTKLAVGITAPIGLSLNWTCSKKSNYKGYDFIKSRNKETEYRTYKGPVFGIFVPIIDIAAPFVYRWSNDNSNGFPKDLKWEQIFSPGIYFSIGLRKTGLTFMPGVQYTPSLRKIIDANAIETRENALRFGLTITYDLPLFTLYKDNRFKPNMKTKKK